MIPGLPLLASLVAVAQAAPATPQQFSGGWCRPSNGVEPKAYLHYELDLGWKPSSEECLAACQEKLEDSLACSEFGDDNACYCMAMSVFGGAVTDFCWSRASLGTQSYVVGIDKPRDCGEGHDCCECDSVYTEHRGDNCASWNFNEEWRKCHDGGMPIPTGKKCSSGLGEILTCCKPCKDGEPPNRDKQVCYDHHIEECDFGEEEWRNWLAKVLIGSIVGTILGIALVVGASLPVCCGIGKDFNLMCPAIAIGLIAGFCFFIPLIAGLVTTDAAIDEHCEKCQCGETSDEDRHNINVLTSLVAYVHGLGFVVVVIAFVAEVLACCMFFRCCGPLSEPRRPGVPVAQQQQPVPGQVVGAPMVGVPIGSGDQKEGAAAPQGTALSNNQYSSVMTT